MFQIYIQTKGGKYFNFKVNDYNHDIEHMKAADFFMIRTIGGVLHFLSASSVLLMSVTEKEVKDDDQ